MWDRIAASGLLIVGAVILFVLFTAALFIMERRDQQKSKQKTQPLRVVRMENTKRAA